MAGLVEGVSRYLCRCGRLRRCWGNSSESCCGKLDWLDMWGMEADESMRILLAMQIIGAELSMQGWD